MKWFTAQWQKDISKFLSAQTISLFGSSLVQYAIIWYITLETKSGAMMMLSTVSGFLPQILISFFAGVWADRYDRKKMIVYADAAIATVTLLLAILFLLGFKSPWLVFMVQAARSFGTGIQSPAVNALVPQLVPKESLMRVNGINSTLQSVTFLISPAVAGAVFGVFGIVPTLFVDVVTAALAIAVMTTLKIPPHERALTVPDSSHWQDFKAGLRYVMTHRLIRSLFVFFALFMFFVVPAAILSPLYVVRAFGDEVWKLTANEMLFSLGAAFGGILVSVWGGFKKRTTTIGVSSLCFGLLTAAMGLAPTLILYLVIIFITGIFIPYFNTATTVLFQEHTEPEMLGRVFSFNSVISSAAFPAGMVVFGPLADRFDIAHLLIGSGILLFIIGLGVFFTPAFRGNI